MLKKTLIATAALAAVLLAGATVLPALASSRQATAPAQAQAKIPPSAEAPAAVPVERNDTQAPRDRRTDKGQQGNRAVDSDDEDHGDKKHARDTRRNDAGRHGDGKSGRAARN